MANMKNQYTDNETGNILERHIDIIKGMKSATALNPINSATCFSGGLSDLQKATVQLMNSESRSWGFSGSRFRVKRRKIGTDLWKITVENPKTREIILEAEGHGDKVFAYEDSLARMAEALIDKDLTITTPARR
jgi:hypothetical protein